MRIRSSDWVDKDCLVKENLWMDRHVHCYSQMSLFQVLQHVSQLHRCDSESESSRSSRLLRCERGHAVGHEHEHGTVSVKYWPTRQSPLEVIVSEQLCSSSQRSFRVRLEDCGGLEEQRESDRYRYTSEDRNQPTM